MARVTSRIQQAYGYAVCLIAIVVGLVALHSTIDALFDRARPQAAFTYGDSETSYEEFKANFGRRNAPNAAAATDATLPDSALRRIYDEQRSSRMANETWRANKSFATNLLLLAACVILFAMHWRWLRKLPDGAEITFTPGTPGST